MRCGEHLSDSFRVVGYEDVYGAIFQILPVGILSVCGELLIRTAHQVGDDRLTSLVSVTKQGRLASAGQIQIDGMLIGSLYRLIYFGLSSGQDRDANLRIGGKRGSLCRFVKREKECAAQQAVALQVSDDKAGRGVLEVDHQLNLLMLGPGEEIIEGWNCLYDATGSGLAKVDSTEFR